MLMKDVFYSSSMDGLVFRTLALFVWISFAVVLYVFGYLGSAGDVARSIVFSYMQFQWLLNLSDEDCLWVGLLQFLIFRSLFG